MKPLLNLACRDMLQIFTTILTGVIGYLGLRVKKIYQESIKERTKKEIIKETVRYVEQTNKNLSCEDKKTLALKKSKEWLNEKKLNISATELEILIESDVNCLKDEQ